MEFIMLTIDTSPTASFRPSSTMIYSYHAAEWPATMAFLAYLDALELRAATSPWIHGNNHATTPAMSAWFAAGRLVDATMHRALDFPAVWL